MLDLGFQYFDANGVWQSLEPTLSKVVSELNESCTVGVLDWPDVVYVARVQARRLVRAALSTGSRIPANASSLGQVLMAYLDPDDLSAKLADLAFEPSTRRTLVTMADLDARMGALRSGIRGRRAFHFRAAA